jgi:alpha-L-fucosidase 2
LPKAWPAGSVNGLRARGGFEVDMEWKEGKLDRAVVRNISSADGKCVVRYGDKSQSMDIARGRSATVLP